MNRKPIIVFALATGVAVAALAGVSHHRAAIIGRAILQALRTPTPAANGAADSSKAEPAGSAPATAAATTAAQAIEVPAGTTLTVCLGEKLGSKRTPTPAASRAADSSKAEPAGSAPATAAATTAAQAIEVPAGTTLTVRLGEKLGSKISQVGQSFSATLDHDVVIDGQTVIAAGASVNGEVTFARPAGALVAGPNLQIKLTSVSVENADLAVVTSIMSFGPTVKGKKKVVRIMRGVLNRGSIGCTFTASSEICEELIHKAVGKEKEVLLAEQSAYSFTLRQPLEIR